MAIDGTQFFDNLTEIVRRGVLSVRTCRSKASLGRYTPKNNALDTVLFLLEHTGFSAPKGAHLSCVRDENVENRSSLIACVTI